MKMELIEASETSAIRTQTPGNYPKENILHIHMNVYLGKDRQRAAQHLAATHNTVANLTRVVEGFGHKLYMDNFFPSPDLYDDLAQKKIFCCGKVRLHRKGMPKDLKPKTLRMKCGDI